MSVTSNKQWQAAGAALLGVVIIHLYWPVLGAGLVWDDSYLLERYGFLPAVEWLGNAFTMHYISPEYYRPIPVLTLILNAQWGADAFAPIAHTVNLAIFLGCVLLLGFLVWQATGKQVNATLLALMLLAFHPAIIEPVTWISGRCDLLATFFILLGLLVETKCANVALRLMLLAIVMLLALLSKEMAVAFPVILMVWRYNMKADHAAEAIPGFWTWLWQQENKPYILMIASIASVYLGLRFFAMGDLLSTRDTVIDARNIGGFINHSLLVGKTFFYYVLLLIFPQYDISVLYPTVYPVSIGDYQGWMGLAGLALVVCVVTLWWKAGKIAMGVLVLLVLFVPISNIRLLIAHDNFIQLRFLLLPICCALIFLYPVMVRRWFAQERVIKIATTAVLGIWLLTNIVNLKITLPLWTNEEALWTWAVESKPESYIAWDNYASVMIAKQEYSRCIDASKKSIEIFPEQAKPYLALTVCYRRLGDTVSARAYASQLLAQPVKRDSGVFSGLLTELAQMDIEGLMVAYGSIKNMETTVNTHVTKTLEQAITLDPKNKHALTLLFVWSYFQGEVDYGYALIERIKKMGAKAIAIENTLKVMKFIPAQDQEQLVLMIARVYEKY